MTLHPSGQDSPARHTHIRTQLAGKIFHWTFSLLGV